MTGEELAAIAAAIAALSRSVAASEAESMPAWRRAMREESVQNGV